MDGRQLALHPISRTILAPESYHCKQCNPLKAIIGRSFEDRKVTYVHLSLFLWQFAIIYILFFSFVSLWFFFSTSFFLIFLMPRPSSSFPSPFHFLPFFLFNFYMRDIHFTGTCIHYSLDLFCYISALILMTSRR